MASVSSLSSFFNFRFICPPPFYAFIIPPKMVVVNINHKIILYFWYFFLFCIEEFFISKSPNAWKFGNEYTKNCRRYYEGFTYEQATYGVDKVGL